MNLADVVLIYKFMGRDWLGALRTHHGTVSIYAATWGVISLFPTSHALLAVYFITCKINGWDFNNSMKINCKACKLMFFQNGVFEMFVPRAMTELTTV